jgi:hypothetical protein
MRSIKPEQHKSLSPRSGRYSLLFLGLLLLLMFASRDGGHARGREVNIGAHAHSERKRSQPEFSPGHVIVRYRSERLAKVQEHAVQTNTLKEQSVPMKIERLSAGPFIL